MKKSATGRTLITAVAVAVISAGASAGKEDVLGTWAGTTEFGTRMETAIEAIDESGRVTGAMCTVRPSGHTLGSRLAPIEGFGYEGWDIHVETGRNLTVYTPLAGGRLQQLETYRDGKGRYVTSTTVLRRTETLRCVHLFGVEPRKLAEIEADTGDTLVGYWHGSWPNNGNAAEMMIEHITPAGEALGRACWKDGTSGLIGIRDLYPGGPTKSKYDAQRTRLQVKGRTAPELRHVTLYRLVTDSTLSVTQTSNVGRPNEMEVSTAMWRGAKPDGCLAMTYLNRPWNGIGTEAAMHPGLGGLGERVPGRRSPDTQGHQGSAGR